MKRDNAADLRAHPEWFEWVPFDGIDRAAALEFLRSGAGLREARDQIVSLLIYPPLTYKRLPVPFVLPIRGCGNP